MVWRVLDMSFAISKYELALVADGHIRMTLQQSLRCEIWHEDKSIWE